MAVVTNTPPRANADHMLQALGLGGRFDVVIVAEDLPDPLPYLIGLERLRARRETALAFEDSVLLAAGVHLVIDDFNDPVLWQKIEQMLA